jgi:hypothetical protein
MKRRHIPTTFWDRVRLAIFRRIVASQIHQGEHHHERLARLYRIVAEESRREFTEDNMPTQYYFLTEAAEMGFSEVWENGVTKKMRETWAGFAHKRI